MNINPLAQRWIPCLSLALLALSPTAIHAEQFGLFTYEVTDEKVTITNYPNNATGQVEIPAEIQGLPVVGIARYAFSDCSGLTSVTIPEGVTDIPAYAFDGCTSLAEFDVDPQNSNYASEDGVLFNRSRTELIRCPEGKSGSYAIPDSVSRIDHTEWVPFLPPGSHGSAYLIGVGSAFSGCKSLTRITVPESISELHQQTFEGCTALNSLIFVGDSPHFAIRHACPEEAPEIFGTEHLVIPGSPPVPRLSDGHLSIRFDPTFRGFGYRVETSRDLVHWTTEGVILSEIGPDGYVNASVPIDGSSRFLRLVPYITNWTADEWGCLG